MKRIVSLAVMVFVAVHSTGVFGLNVQEAVKGVRHLLSKKYGVLAEEALNVLIMNPIVQHNELNKNPQRLLIAERTKQLIDAFYVTERELSGLSADERQQFFALQAYLFDVEKAGEPLLDQESIRKVFDEYRQNRQVDFETKLSFASVVNFNQFIRNLSAKQQTMFGCIPKNEKINKLFKERIVFSRIFGSDFPRVDTNQLLKPIDQNQLRTLEKTKYRMTIFHLGQAPTVEKGETLSSPASSSPYGDASSLDSRAQSADIVFNEQTFPVAWKTIFETEQALLRVIEQYFLTPLKREVDQLTSFKNVAEFKETSAHKIEDEYLSLLNKAVYGFLEKNELERSSDVFKAAFLLVKNVFNQQSQQLYACGIYVNNLSALLFKPLTDLLSTIYDQIVSGALEKIELRNELEQKYQKLSKHENVQKVHVEVQTESSPENALPRNGNSKTDATSQTEPQPEVEAKPKPTFSQRAKNMWNFLVNKSISFLSLLQINQKKNNA